MGFEPLEKRTLLSVTVKVAVNVTNLTQAVAAGNVPVIGAAVLVNYTSGGVSKTETFRPLPKDQSGQPNSTFASKFNLASGTGLGEDNEISVAEMLYQIDYVGVKGQGYPSYPSSQFIHPGTIEPDGAKKLFKLLFKKKPTDLAQFVRRTR